MAIAWINHTGVPRVRNPGRYVGGLATAWTAKVNLHYKRLLAKVRMQGLFDCRRIAKSMRLAGVGLQTGTVSV